MEMCLKLERVKRFPLMNKYIFLNDENITELGTLFMLFKVCNDLFNISFLRLVDDNIISNNTKTPSVFALKTE